MPTRTKVLAMGVAVLQTSLNESFGPPSKTATQSSAIVFRVALLEMGQNPIDKRKTAGGRVTGQPFRASRDAIERLAVVT